MARLWLSSREREQDIEELADRPGTEAAGVFDLPFAVSSKLLAAFSARRLKIVVDDRLRLYEDMPILADDARIVSHAIEKLMKIGRGRRATRLVSVALARKDGVRADTFAAIGRGLSGSPARTAAQRAVKQALTQACESRQLLPLLEVIDVMNADFMENDSVTHLLASADLDVSLIEKFLRERDQGFSVEYVDHIAQLPGHLGEALLLAVARQSSGRVRTHAAARALPLVLEHNAWGWTERVEELVAMLDSLTNAERLSLWLQLLTPNRRFGRQFYLLVFVEVWHIVSPLCSDAEVEAIDESLCTIGREPESSADSP